MLMNMDITSLIFSVIVYIAFGVLALGFLSRIWLYASSPAPLKIPLTPAPINAGGVLLRMLQEIFLFKSLFKSSKLIWVGGFILHVGLFFAFLKHMRFYFLWTPPFLHSFVGYEMFPGIIMLIGLCIVLVLRLSIDRTFYVSILSDYLLVFLLMAISLSGVAMKYFYRADVVYVKRFMIGLISFHPAPIPDSLSFMVHISFVVILFIYFPFSKLMHSGGIFFSPTRNQIDNPREKRHVTPWAVS
jgi:nitrate reductase gamma subunit